jgi:CysZ protein
MGSLLRGFACMSKRPTLWAYAWGPVILTALLYIGLLVVAQVSLRPLIDRLAPDDIPWLSGLPIIGGIALFLLWLIGANFVVIAISSLFSGLLWGKLSHAVESDIYGDAPDVRLGCLPQIKDALLRLIQAFLAVIAVIVFGWASFIVAPAVAGVLGVIEFSAPAYARRGVIYPQQLRVLKLPSALGFGFGTAVLSVIPILFVFVMPALVVGATILCREGEKPRS